MYFAKTKTTETDTSTDGPFSVFDFPSNVPAPWNAIIAILHSDMLEWSEKIRLGIGLIPAYVFGDEYVKEQEKVTVQEWMDQRGIPQSVTDEVFVAISKALGFIGPEQLSMQCVLIALNRFLQETNGSRIAFLDGNPTERLCEPIRQYVQARGGIVRTNAPVRAILTHPDEAATVAGLLLADDEVVSADEYVSAMPVDALRTLIPDAWKEIPYFAKLSKLRGVPVMNLHVWFDRKLDTIDNLIFSRSPLLSVYADMSIACNEYADPNRSMLELVLAPAAPYMKYSDEEILNMVLLELERLFPTEICADGSLARVTKFTCVRTPTSVYTTVPGVEDCRPTQRSPIANFYVAGDFSLQKYLASMEGAILSGVLAATAVAEDATLPNRHRSRPLTPRPPNSGTSPTATTPDRTMYVTKRATTIPSAILEELSEKNDAGIGVIH
jgi:15-cis-phytoene desaturase